MKGYISAIIGIATTGSHRNYDHSVEVVRQEKLDLIKNWIDNGVKARF